MQNEIIRRRIDLYGWVQGVGLRWRAENAANALGVTGWVRNNYDDSVTMELQGTETQLDGVLLAVERGSYVRIENMRVKTLPTTEDEWGFTVQYDE
jgi:acylphosphatase